MSAQPTRIALARHLAALLILAATLMTVGLSRPDAGAAERVDDRRWLNVIATIPLPGEYLTERMVFIFDDEIKVPGDDASRLVSTDPVLAGDLRVGRNFISFRPHQLPAREAFEVALSPDIRSIGGRQLNPAHRKLVFATAPFGPERLWRIGEERELTVFGITFPRPVNLDVLRQNVSVKSSSGSEIPFDIEQGTNDVTYRLLVEKSEAWNIVINIKEGLPDARGIWLTEETHTYSYPSERPLSVESVQWSAFSADRQSISITFSDTVEAEDLQRHLTITDALTNAPHRFTITTPGRRFGHRIALNVEETGRVELRVTIAQDLASTELVTLKKPFTTTLVHVPPPLSVQSIWWDRHGKDGLVMRLWLNKPADFQALQEYLEISPAVPNLRVEAQDAVRFRVHGDWIPEWSYTLRIKAGFKAKDGIALDNALTRRLKTPEVWPYVGFAPEGKYYFPRRANLGPVLESRAVNKATLTLYRMFPSNIAVVLADIRNGNAGSSFGPRWCEELATSELELGDDVGGGLKRTQLDAADLFPADAKGVFCLQVVGEKDVQATKIALLTNIGLLAHWQDDELVVFAHDLMSLQPLRRAKVTVFSSKNQMLREGRTGRDGTVHLKGLDTSLGMPRVVVVEHGDDYSFLDLTAREEKSPEILAGMSAYGRDEYDAFMYSDRDLYRPGDVVHLRWIVRTNYGDALPGVPLLITVVKPNGKKLLSQPTVLSSLGTGSLDIATQSAYPTGQYEAQLTVPKGKSPLGTHRFKLEEFVPNRIKAAVTVEEDRWISGNSYEVAVNARHLFGAPAADRKCEVELVPRRKGLVTKRWKGYQFTNDSEFQPRAVSLGESKTDDHGNALFTCDYTAPADATCPVTAMVVGHVYELGGRSVTASVETTLFPSETCLGVLAAPAADVREVDVAVAAIRPDESPADLDSVTITLEKQVWNYYVRRYYSHHEPNWSESFEPVDSRTAELTDGTGSAQFRIEGYGYYRVRVHSPATPQYSTVSFYSYGRRIETVDAARPSLIKIGLDRDEYEVGDEAVVRVESPFDGKGFVVLQGQSIQRIVTLEIVDNVGVARFKLSEEQVPNVWVEATVVHAIQQDHAQVYPFSSFAVANVRVRDPRRKLTVAFPSLPEEIRPATAATFEIETRDIDGKPVESEVTLAAVDEGIHLITNYRDPDPYGHFGRSRQPVLKRTHYYDKVAYDFDKPDAAGGDAREMAKRLAAADVNWIKAVALWSGVVETDRNGRASVTMDVPEFTGQLRLVAVACSSDAAGSGRRDLLVRRPHMLRTSMPRFMLPGDSARCRAVVFNNTDAPCKAKVSWSASGTLRTATGSRELAVAPRSEADLAAEIVAGPLVGQGEIQWDAVILGADGQTIEHLTEVAPVPVRAPAAFQSHHELVVLKAQETRTFSNVRFIEDERTEIAITLGANPLLRLQNALAYAVGYPYGCVEQTTSKLMPMYLLRRSSELMTPELTEGLSVEAAIQVGIDRLFSMQTVSGGLGTWPGSTQAYSYGSVYALHFLTLVKNDRELEVPTASFDLLQDYVRRIARDWDDNSQSALYQRAYAVYVLALGGDLEAVKAIERFDEVKVPRSARFLLAAALAQHTKDDDRVSLYLSSAPSERYTVTEQDGTLNSDIRNTAVELLALRQIGNDPGLMAEKADKLVAFLEAHRHGSTQETALIITALAGYLSDLAEDAHLGSTTITGPTSRRDIRGAEVYRGSHHGPGGMFTVANTGAADLFVNVTTRGIPEKPDLAAMKEGIGVGREFWLPQGTRHTGTTFSHTRSYVVKLNIDCERSAKNLIVADLLPAGFEIVNPRLDVDAVPKAGFPGGVTPTHLEIRDDRLVVVFSELREGVHHFYYVVQAVTPGKFDYPAVQAECMYDASVRGRSIPTSIEIAR